MIKILLTALVINLNFGTPFSSSGDTVAFYDLISQNGVFYLKGTSEPFSGTIDDIHYSGRVKLGRQEGEWTTTRPDGQLLSRRYYLNGKKHGIELIYLSPGKLSSKTRWNRGKKDGFQELYHLNGELFHRTQFKKGVQDGVFESFDQNGLLIWRGFFKDGEIVAE